MRQSRLQSQPSPQKVAQYKHLILSQQYRVAKPNYFFNLLSSFKSISDQSSEKLEISVSDSSFHLHQGKNLYSWGFDEAKFQIKTEKYTIRDVKQIGTDVYILNNQEQCYKSGLNNSAVQGVSKVCRFQQTLLFLTNKKQIIDLNKNIIKQEVDDIVSSEQFLISRTKDTVNVIGNFQFQLSFEEQISQIACGLNHILCLTRNQQLYAWGEGTSGQIGNGHFKNQFWPLLVQNSVNQIACGLRSSCIIKQNQLYWCGTNQKLMKQTRFIPYDADEIFLTVSGVWSQSVEILYAQTLHVDDNWLAVLETRGRTQTTEFDDELLVPEDNFSPNKEFEKRINRRHLVEESLERSQTFNTRQSQQNKKSRTPVKKLKFQ